MHIDSTDRETILAHALQFAGERGLGLSERQVVEMLDPVIDGMLYLDSAYIDWAEVIMGRHPSGIDIDIGALDKTIYYIVLQEWGVGEHSTKPALSMVPSDVRFRQERGFSLVGVDDEAERAMKNFLWREVFVLKKLGSDYSEGEHAAS